MSYSYAAWPTPAAVSDILAAANITLPYTVSGNVIQAEIDAAAATVGKRTHRQFIADTVDKVRYYNGSGNAMMYIDEYVDITSVYFLFYPSIAGVNLANYVEVEQSTYPKTKIQIYQGPANATYAFLHNFPEGRSNIQITGKWGYGATIPQDLWLAVAQKAAGELATMAALQLGGKVTWWQELDAQEKLMEGSFSDVAGWSKNFDAICALYKRPASQFLNYNKPPLL